MTLPVHPEPRPYCYRCDKPESMCLCDYLAPVANTVGVHVLQHPAERRHALGTARIVRLGLQSAQIHRMRQRQGSAATEPVELPPGAGLLYPSPDAQVLDDLPAAERPEHLVVIDGTWSQAHRIYRDNDWIQALPKYCLAPHSGSRYRIRKEPRLECLSTVEAVTAALRCLEPDLKGTERLDRAFDAMIDAQIIESARPSVHGRTKRSRNRRPAQVPDALRMPHASIVVVYAEPEPQRDGDTGPRGAMRISAVGLHSDTLFDCLVDTPLRPDAYVLNKMGLDPAHLQAAEPPNRALSSFQDYCDAGGAPVVLTAWNLWTHRWLSGLELGAPNILLKSVWANLRKERIPGLENLVTLLDLTVQALPIAGRAGVRLAQARAMAQHIVAGLAREA